jgi:hypothetical protein
MKLSSKLVRIIHTALGSGDYTSCPRLGCSSGFWLAPALLCTGRGRLGSEMVSKLGRQFDSIRMSLVALVLFSPIESNGSKKIAPMGYRKNA